MELEWARVEFPREIHIHGLNIYLPDCPRSDKNKFFSADNVVLEYRAESLLARKVTLGRVVAGSARLNIWYDRKNKIRNIDRLAFKSSGSKAPQTEFILRNARFEYAEYEGPKAMGRFVQEVSGRIVPSFNDPSVYTIVLDSRDIGVFKNTHLIASLNVESRQIELKTDFQLNQIDLESVPESLSRLQLFYEKMIPQGEVAVSGQYTLDKGFTFDIAIHQGNMILPLVESGMNILVENIDATVRCLNERIEIVDLKLALDDNCQVSAKGHIDGYRSNVPYWLEFQTQGFSLPPDYWDDFAVNEVRPKSTLDILVFNHVVNVPLNRQGLKTLLNFLHPQAQKALYDQRPTGQMDLRVSVAVEDPEKPSVIKGRVDMVHMAGVSHYFPYPVDGLTGSIEFDNKLVKIGPIHNKPGYQPVFIDGDFHRLPEGLDFDLTVKIAEMEFNDRLYQAVPTQYRKIWDQLHPQGRVSGDYHIVHHPDEESEQSLKLMISGCQAQPEILPVELSDLAGQINWDSQSITVNIQQGRALDGELFVQGTVNGLDLDAIEADLDLTFRDIRADPNFGALLGGDTGRLWNQFGLQAQLNGSAHIHTPSDSADIKNPGYQVTFDTRFQNAVIDPNNFPIRLAQASGRAIYDGVRLEVSDLSANYKDQPLTGALDLVDNNHFNLAVRIDEIEFDDEIKKLVSPYSGILNYLDVSGKMGAELLFDKDGDQTNHDIRLDLKQCDIGIKNKPFRFDHTVGRISIHPDLIEVQDLQAFSGLSSLRGQGRIDLSGRISGSEIHLELEKLQLDDILRALICEAPDCQHIPWDAEGQVDMDLKFGWQRQSEASGGWQMTVDTQLQHGKIEGPLAIGNIAGKINGKLNMPAAEGSGMSLSGHFNGLAFDYRHIGLSDLTGNFDYDSDHQKINIANLSGKLGQGRIAGTGGLVFNTQGGYNAEIQLSMCPWPIWYLLIIRHSLYLVR